MINFLCIYTSANRSTRQSNR